MEVSGKHHNPAALPPAKISGTHCMGWWVGPSSQSGRFVQEKKVLPLCWDLKPGPPPLYTDYSVPFDIQRTVHRDIF